MDRLHILDGHGYIFRAFYGLAQGGRAQASLRTTKGMPTGALYVFASMLIRLLKDVDPKRVVVVFDAPGKSFRAELSQDYKATRKETPEELKVQLPYFQPLTEAFSWPVLSIKGVEADDVIATLVSQARQRGWDATIYSGDKDLMQLVDEHVAVVDSMRQIHYDEERVVSKFGVKPTQLGDWLALVGDKSDNVPGMPGIGKVGATKLLTAHGNLDEILAHVSEMKGKQRERFEDEDNLKQLELSRKLVTLKDDVEVGVQVDDLKAQPWDSELLEQRLEELEFSSLLDRLGGNTSGASKTAKKATSKARETNTASASKELAKRKLHFDKLKPQVVNDAKGLKALCQALTKASSFALYPLGDGARHDRESLVGLSFATKEALYYLPLGHRYLGVDPQLALDSLDGDFACLMQSHESKKVAFDSKYALRLLAHFGLELGGMAGDLMLLSYVLDASGKVPELHALATKLLQLDLPSEKQVLGTGKSAKHFSDLYISDAADYASQCAWACLVLEEHLRHSLRDKNETKLYEELEIPLAGGLAAMEERGVLLDSGFLSEFSQQLGSELAKLETLVFELAGESFNLGSPKQLSQVLFEKMGLRAARMKKTKTGYSTDHEILESMRQDHQIIAPILEYRELVKLKNTYVDALPPLVNPKTGRLHTNFRQALAATGRLSSQEPNLQNIPIRTKLGREIRRAFIAPPGKVLLSADYSQIELRIMAHLSEDPVLMGAFNAGIDVHSQTAAEVFDCALDAVDDEMRRVAKAVNYGLIYGQSEFGLAQALDIPRYKAAHYIQRYFAEFARVRVFMDEIVREAASQGGATTVLGRRRPIPNLAAKNHHLRKAAERVAQNTPMQGSAADIMKIAMVDMDKRVGECGDDCLFLLTVHDEFLFEVPKAKAQEMASLAKEVMEGAYELKVPLTVDVGWGSSWNDAH